ncbi:adenylate kinase [Dokdonia pacifica]|uniref:Adenylate kinase n=1 Tax=Dokdonia pacifica TaxID=1627892 RepID=A0A238W633_9FLAO|nr:nucleoside monophosphate kinase [Dokdonia pacifica]GGG14696.1 adenylate kinase [Dokdonia pacifica]SNR42012.1 Adenylate kinase [Dokdonia pacifica]
MNVIIFGPPLAGKGTQSKKIIQDFGLTHLSTGDVLRAEKAQKTELGIKAAEYSSKGLLVPDHLTAQIVERFYHNHKNEKGILFDGYPRNTIQAEHLLQVIAEGGETIDKVIFLKVPKEELLKRAIKRAEAENRADDKDSSIVLTRIDEFQNGTIPAIQHIRASGTTVVEIDGNQSIDAIYKTINTHLK